MAVSSRQKNLKKARMASRTISAPPAPRTVNGTKVSARRPRPVELPDIRKEDVYRRILKQAQTTAQASRQMKYSGLLSKLIHWI